MRMYLLPVILLFGVCIDVCSANVHAWDYGARGPKTWKGDCATGKHQSPINIEPTRVIMDNISPDMVFHHYDSPSPAPWALSSAGHFVFGQPPDMSKNRKLDKGQAEYGISGGGLDGFYRLLSFHFHWSSNSHVGSEHTMSKNHFAIEAHFVHVKKGLSVSEALKRSDGLAVVGVWFQVRPTAEVKTAERMHPLGPLTGHIKVIKDKKATSSPEAAVLVTDSADAVVNMDGFKLGDILPKHRQEWYRYNGSLTTPGCQESVVWTVLAHRVIITEKEMEEFRIIAHNEDLETEYGSVKNWRPTQPLNGRVVHLRSPHIKHKGTPKP